MKTVNNQVVNTDSAHRKVENLKSLYVHLMSYVVVNVLIYAASLHGFGLHNAFWKMSLFVTGVFGAIGVIGHWADAIGYRLIFPEKKEAGLIEKFLKEEENKGV